MCDKDCRTLLFFTALTTMQVYLMFNVDITISPPTLISV